MSQPAANTTKAALKTPAYAWVVLFSIYLATLAGPLNQFKVPPLLPILRSALDMDYGRSLWLMSIFSVMGIILAIPAGFILQRIGIKATGIIALGTTMIGSGLGALAHTPAMLFISRFIEGSGMGLMMVVAPSAISLWFPAEKRALPMGIWASAVGIGYFAAFNLAPRLATGDQWQILWWTGAAIAAAALVIFGALFRMPKPEEASEIAAPEDAKAEDAPVNIGRAMANRNLWLLGISFGCFNIVVLAINSSYPDFLNTVRQYPMTKASFISSLVMLMAIFAGAPSGRLSDRLKSRKAMIVIPFILTAVLFLFPFTATGWMIPAFTVALGIMAAPIVPIILAAVPEVMPSLQTAGIGVGVVTLCQNIGMFLGPVLFGQLLELTNKNWAAAGYALIPICIIGAIAALMTKFR